MQFVTSKIKTTVPVGLGEATQKKEARPLDEILDGLRASKQVKTAAMGAPVGAAPVGTEVEEACGSCGKMAEPNGMEVEQAAAAPVQTEEACMAGDVGEVEVAAVEPLAEEESKGLFEDPLEQEDQPLFASAKPTILKVAKKADFRQWNPENVIKAWKGFGSQEKCVVAMKGQTNDPKKYCFLLQTASEEAHKFIKTAKKEEKVTAPQGVFKKIASLPDKDRNELYNYWKGLYGEAYAKAMLDNYVK